jgi:hypothetical protein
VRFYPDAPNELRGVSMGGSPDGGRSTTLTRGVSPRSLALPSLRSSLPYRRGRRTRHPNAPPPPPRSRMRDSSDRGDAWQSTPLPVRARCARMVAAAAEEVEEDGEDTAARRGGGGRGSAPPASADPLPGVPPLTQLSIAGNTKQSNPRGREDTQARARGNSKFSDTPRAPATPRVFIGHEGGVSIATATRPSGRRGKLGLGSKKLGKFF